MGDPRAQHSLGLAYFRGEGVPRDLIESYKWFYIAVALTSGSDRQLHMTLRDSVGTNMTGDELAEAQKRAREWRPRAPQ